MHDDRTFHVIISAAFAHRNIHRRHASELDIGGFSFTPDRRFAFP